MQWQDLAASSRPIFFCLTKNLKSSSGMIIPQSRQLAHLILNLEWKFHPFTDLKVKCQAQAVMESRDQMGLVPCPTADSPFFSQNNLCPCNREVSLMEEVYGLPTRLSLLYLFMRDSSRSTRSWRRQGKTCSTQTWRSKEISMKTAHSNLA